MTEAEQQELERLRAENAELKAQPRPALNGFGAAVESARREAMWATTGAQGSTPITEVEADAATVVLHDMGLL